MVEASMGWSGNHDFFWILRGNSENLEDFYHQIEAFIADVSNKTNSWTYWLYLTKHYSNCWFGNDIPMKIYETHIHSSTQGKFQWRICQSWFISLTNHVHRTILHPTELVKWLGITVVLGRKHRRYELAISTPWKITILMGKSSQINTIIYSSSMNKPWLS